MLLCWPCYTITSPYADHLDQDHQFVRQHCDESWFQLPEDQHADNACPDTAAHYQCVRLAQQCRRAVVIPREHVRGQHTGRPKVGIFIECNGLPQASTQLEQASGGLAIAANFP